MPKRVLVVKTSSLGDVIHTLPALSDAAAALPGISFDWIVEQPFAEVPSWHPAVDKVIPVSIRQWRKHPLQARKSGDWRRFKADISEHDYDLVIDAQGLLKSAWLLRYARGEKHGLDTQSAREPWSSRFYQVSHAVAKGQHAVERVRQLFAATLGYSLTAGERGDYNLQFSYPRERQVLLLHGTTWPTKHWLEGSWSELAELLKTQGYQVLIPWGNDLELQRAKRIASSSGATVLNKLSLTELAKLLASSAGCVSVDTGLGHLAAAVNTPTIALFGPTNPTLTGFYGQHQKPLKATLDCAPCMKSSCRVEPDFQSAPPCFATLSPEQVLSELQGQIQLVEVGV